MGNDPVQGELFEADQAIGGSVAEQQSEVKPLDQIGPSVAEAPAAPAVFELEGHVGQFAYPHEALTAAPHIVAAIWSVCIPFKVELAQGPDGKPWFRCLGWSQLFRKLEGNDAIPPYEFSFEQQHDEIAVSAKEMPIPKDNRIIVPNRQARREMGRHARLHGLNGEAK